MTKRINWVDSLKGILILIVVCSHAIQYVLKEASFDNHFFNYLISFMMPAFFTVSGYVNYRQEGGANLRDVVLKRRFRQLVIPFILWASIRAVINPPITLESFTNIILYPDGSFWFLWVLFIITTIFIVGDWISEKLKIKQEIVIAVISILLALMMVLCEIRVLGFQFIAYYFLFFSTGYYINKYSSFLMGNTKLYLFALLLWGVMGWFWDMHKLPSFLETVPLPSSVMQYLYRFITALVAICFIFGLSPKLLNKDHGINKPFIYLGKISLGIYTAHLLFMPFIVEALALYFNNSLVLVLLSFIVSLFISWILVELLSRWRITSMLLLGKI